MTNRALHILNGDSTLTPFVDSGIKGDVVIWREILSEGPAQNTSLEDFFRLRSDYINQLFGESPDIYRERVVKEFYKIVESETYDEIFLWFEHDLVCQVNLLFILNALAANKHSKIYVIQFFKTEKHKEFKGFGALTGTQIAERFQHRLFMKPSSFEFAVSCWKYYAGIDPFPIQEIIPSIPEEFPFLPSALKAHLQRFPSVKNGLNRLQQQLLELLAGQVLSTGVFIQQFLQTESIYGITDWIVFKMIEDLQPDLINTGAVISLTGKGKNILEGPGILHG
jgi:hypothetical protein